MKYISPCFIVPVIHVVHKGFLHGFIGILLVLTMMRSGGMTTIAAEEYPYRAAIEQQGALVRSGPGNMYYPTGRLQRGDVVEIYRETEDGWLAIRPPVGSFSWISGNFAALGMDNVATIAIDGLAARIGSSLTENSAEDGKTVQVRLGQGDRVLVFERVETPSNPISPYWYKISPPRGEFRWVHACAFYEDETLCQSTHQTNPQKTPLSHSSSLPQPIPLPTVRETPVTNTEKTVVQVSHIEEMGGEDETVFPLLPTPLPTSLPMVVAAVPPPAVSLPLSNIGGLKSAAPMSATPPPPLSPFMRAFTDLQTATFQAMDEPGEDWVFDVLLQRGQDLYSKAPTDRDRARVGRLLEALETTKQVRRELALTRMQEAIQKGRPLPNQPTVVANPADSTRYRNTTTAIPQPAPQNVITLQSENTPITPSTNPAMNRPSYHAVGRLGRFNPAPAGYPPYALADEKQQIVCYVIPSPTLNLGPLVGKTVGLMGTPSAIDISGRRSPLLQTTVANVLE